jgi:drug/metabolite transporter (DMT)-like permease
MALSATAVYIVAGAITAAGLSGFDASSTAHDSVRFLINPWIRPSLVDFGLLAVCGVIAALGFFLLSQGYRLAEANRAAPFEFAALPWGILWGYLFFRSVPDAFTICGAMIVVATGLYTLRHAQSGGAADPQWQEAEKV